MNSRLGPVRRINKNGWFIENFGFCGSRGTAVNILILYFFLNSKYYFHLLRIRTNFQTKRQKSVCLVFGVCVTTILELDYCAGGFCVNTQLETCLSSFPVSQNRDLKYQTGSLPFEIINRHWSWEILDGVEKLYRKIQRCTYLCPNALISQLIAIYQFDEELQLKKKQVKTLRRFEARPLPLGAWSNP